MSAEKIVSQPKLTRREQRLARAIEGLSARDMQRLLDRLAKSYLQHDIALALLDYAAQVKS